MSTLVFTADGMLRRRKRDPFNFISPAPPPCSRRSKRRDVAKKEPVDVLRPCPPFPLALAPVDAGSAFLVSLKSSFYADTPFAFFRARDSPRVFSPRDLSLSSPLPAAQGKRSLGPEFSGQLKSFE